VPSIVRNLPFFSTPTRVRVQGREVPVKADQIILWVSLTDVRRASLDAGYPYFPAILDIGHNHNFAIQERQLVDWAGLDPRLLAKLGEIRIRGDSLPLLEANVWLYRNTPGERAPAVSRPPFRVEIGAGVAVYPRALTTAPRLPFLGLRALRVAGLRLNIDGQAQRVTIRTPRRFWFF
jgi:hypothetical protein